MSFLGCIGTLTKASGVDVLLTAAFGRVADIITGKSWTNVLRAYRLTTTVLGKTGNKPKQEGEIRRKMDETNRNKIAEELQKHSHPLKVTSTDLYNIVNGMKTVVIVNGMAIFDIETIFVRITPIEANIWQSVQFTYFCGHIGFW